METPKTLDPTSLESAPKDLTDAELLALDDPQPHVSGSGFRLDQVPLSGEYQAAWEKACAEYLKILPGNAFDKVYLVFSRLKNYEQSESSKTEAFYSLGYVPRDKKDNLASAPENRPYDKRDIKLIHIKKQGAIQFLDDLRDMLGSMQNPRQVVMQVFVSKYDRASPVLLEDFRVDKVREVRDAAQGQPYANGSGIAPYRGMPSTGGFNDPYRSAQLGLVATTPEVIAEEVQRQASDLFTRFQEQERLRRAERIAVKYKRLSEELAERNQQLEKELHAAKAPERIADSLTKATPLLAGALSLLGGARGAEIGRTLLGAAAPAPAVGYADQPEPQDPYDRIRWLIHRFVDGLPKEALVSLNNILGVVQGQPQALPKIEAYAVELHAAPQSTASE